MHVYINQYVVRMIALYLHFLASQPDPVSACVLFFPMQVVTPSPFLLAAHSLTEVEISIKTYSTGNHHVIVTAVGIL